MNEMHARLKVMKNEQAIKTYGNLRSMFKKLIKTIELSVAYEANYHGIQIITCEDTSFSMLFFDRINVVARFSGMTNEADGTMYGRIAFEQEGKSCRTYYFDEQGKVFDEIGKNYDGVIDSVQQVDNLLSEVTHELIRGGIAFESFAFIK